MILGVAMIRCNTQGERFAADPVHGWCSNRPINVGVRFAAACAICTLDTASILDTIR